MAKSSRKRFLAAAGAAGVSALAPAAAASAHAPSATATAFAKRMRTFDPHLTDAQIAQIARGIDQSLAAGKALRPKQLDLSAGDPPSPQFKVGE